MIDELSPGGPWRLLLVQGTACLAAGLAASYVLRHRPARAHQILLTALWAAVLMPGLYLSAQRLGLGVLAPPTAPPAREILETQPLDTALGAEVVPPPDVYEPTTAPSAESVAAGPADPVAPGHRPWGAVTIACWLAATLVLLTRMALRFLLGFRLLRAADPVETEQVGHALEEARSRLGIGAAVRVRHSERVRSPVIWCWVREPVLLLHKAAGDREGTNWVGVFCHELAHWRRRDHLSGLFAELLVAVLPWHPLLWWARGRLLKLSEQACDDWVLATGHSGVDYAELLLGLAAERQMAFLPTVIGKEKTMHTRIRRIIKENGSDPRLGMCWTMLVGALALCASVGVAVAQRRPAGPEPMDAPPTKIFKERREIEVREPPGADQQRIAMKRLLERLMKQADEKKEMLREGNDLSEEERQIQQIELKLLVEQIEQMKNRFEVVGRETPMRRAPVKIAPKESFEPEREARFDALRQGREELEQRGQKLEREIKGLRDGQDQEARELKSQLEQIRDKKVLVEKEMAELKLAQADDLKRKKLDELKRAQAEVRREIVVRKPAAEEQDREELLQNEEKLQFLRLRAEKLARMVQEDPATDTKEARTRRKLLEVIRAEINALEQEPRGLDGTKEAPGVAPKREYRIIKEEVKIEKKAPDGPPRTIKGPAGTGNPRLEAEVQELRDQMKELHGQMQQIQKLLEQAVERGRIETPAR